jgi:hypothetical protein
MNIIYALIDPREPDAIRYVGKSYRPSRRLVEHLNQASRGEGTHKAAWIRSVLSAGVRPEVVELERVGEDWQERERAWVGLLRASGHRLTNGTDGGEGGMGAEGRAKLSRAMKGRVITPEHRAKIGDANRGRRLAPETIAERQAHRVYGPAWNKGQPTPPETRAKQRAAKLGKPRRPDVVLAVAAAHRGSKRSAETRARMAAARRAWWERRRTA